MAFGATKPKLGSRTVKKPPQHPSFVRGSRPENMKAPTPKSLNTRDYGKIATVPGGGFGTTGFEREP